MTLRIIRESKMVNFARAFKVYVDNQLAAEIRNGAEAVVSLSSGVHSICFKIGRSTKALLSAEIYESTPDVIINCRAENNGDIAVYTTNEAVRLMNEIGKKKTRKKHIIRNVMLVCFGIILIIGLINGNSMDSGKKEAALSKTSTSAQPTDVPEQTKAPETKEDYILECKTVDYSDVARNPDTYKGERITISGKVIQVAEGWFDSVTLRIDCDGNIWYATYSREENESRILENDMITAYGECDGVKTYMTVLGSQNTIPSIKIKYYE